MTYVNMGMYVHSFLNSEQVCSSYVHTENIMEKAD
jgi:hypothetical protein